MRAIYSKTMEAVEPGSIGHSLTQKRDRETINEPPSDPNGEPLSSNR